MNQFVIGNLCKDVYLYNIIVPNRGSYVKSYYNLVE